MKLHLPEMPNLKKNFGKAQQPKNKSSIFEPVDLIQSNKLLYSMWIDASTSRFPVFATKRRVYAELRDNVLLLYPAEQVLTILFNECVKKWFTKNQSYQARYLTIESLEGLSLQVLEMMLKTMQPRWISVFPLESTEVLKWGKRGLVIRRIGKSKKTTLILDSWSSRQVWLDIITAATSTAYRKGLSDYALVEEIGSGAYGRVYHMIDRITAESTAMKVMEKKILRNSKFHLRHAVDERKLLTKIQGGPFLLDFKYAFQSQERLYLVTEYCRGGDLRQYMDERAAPFAEYCARFIAAEAVIALEFLHGLGIMHRDVKPGNIFLNSDGHIKLADFGLAKMLIQSNGILGRTFSFCGTKSYMAPEMWRDQGYDVGIDFWAFGAFVYELVVGYPPFLAEKDEEFRQEIEDPEICFPDHLSSNVQRLISELLIPAPEKRLGNAVSGWEEIKQHNWFIGVDWKAVKQRLIESPLKDEIVTVQGEHNLKLNPVMKALTLSQQNDLHGVLGDSIQHAEKVSEMHSTESVVGRPKALIKNQACNLLPGYCLQIASSEDENIAERRKREEDGAEENSGITQNSTTSEEVRSSESGIEEVSATE